ELIPDRRPRPAAVVGALDDLAEPARALRRPDAVRRRRRALHVVDLPPAEERAGDAPPLARAVRFEDERPLPRADENPDAAHRPAPATAVVLPAIAPPIPVEALRVRARALRVKQLRRRRHTAVGPFALTGGIRMIPRSDGSSASRVGGRRR